MLTQISIPLALASLIGLLIAIALIPAWIFLIKIEERELIGYWKEKYLSYKKKVPTLIPDFKKIIFKTSKNTPYSEKQ